MLDKDKIIRLEAGVEYVKEVDLLRLVLVDDGLVIGVIGIRMQRQGRSSPAAW